MSESSPATAAATSAASTSAAAASQSVSAMTSAPAAATTSAAAHTQQSAGSMLSATVDVQALRSTESIIGDTPTKDKKKAAAAAAATSDRATRSATGSAKRAGPGEDEKISTAKKQKTNDSGSVQGTKELQLVKGEQSLHKIAAEALAIKKLIEEANIEGVHLLKGALPESKRTEDEHRVYFDLLGLHKDKKLKEEHEELHKALEPLIPGSEAAFRAQLKKQLNVDEGKLHMVVLKVLVTKPGAAAQEVHMDEVTDANKCWGVLLHCTQSNQSTYVPADNNKVELLRKLTAKDTLSFDEFDEARNMREKSETNLGFKSEAVQVGDALFFRTDVAHYGPAVAANESHRVILYALFSIEAIKEKDHADEQQLHPLADLESHGTRLRQELKRKQEAHLIKGHRLTTDATKEMNEAKKYAAQIELINKAIKKSPSA